MKKYSITILLLLLFFFNTAKAQDILSVKDSIYTKNDSLFQLKLLQPFSTADYTVQMPEIIPPSPQSQLFQKYINHEITEYNGLPNIEISLYEIEVKGGLKIPITLSYHASGIKYKQYDGDIGAGWSISAGGYRVTRTVHGKPDELYNFCDLSELDKFKTSGTEAQRDAFLASIAPIGVNNSQALTITNGKYSLQDGEYDQFTYMLPSTNGNFIITNRSTKEVAIIEKQLDKIILDEGENNLTLNNIKVIDNSGFTYLMGKNPDNNLLVEYTSNQADRASYKMAWPVKRITSPFGEIIDFKYSEIDTKRYEYPSLAITGATLNDYNNNDSYTDTYASGGCIYNSPYTFKEMIFIDKIQTSKETIIFIRENDGANPYLLREIQIKDNLNNEIKRITFNREISPKNADPNASSQYYHHLLTSLKIGLQNNQMEEYKFKYYDAAKSAVPDQWGYYIKDFYTIAPNDMFLHIELLKEKILKEGRTTSSQTALYNTLMEDFDRKSQASWVNRTQNEQTPDNFSLKSIIYPTGGITTYEYESHKYKNENGLIYYGGGQRIKRITSYDPKEIESKPIITEFKYGENENGLGIIDISLVVEHFVSESFNIRYSPDPIIYPTKVLLARTPSKTFSMNPSLSDITASTVRYPQMTIYKINYTDTNTTQYKITSKYNIPITYKGKYDEFYSRLIDGRKIGGLYTIQPWASMQTHYRNPINIGEYRLGMKPTIQSRTFFDNNNNLVKKEVYAYELTDNNLYKNLKVSQKVFSDEQSILNHFANRNAFYQIINSFFDYMHYDIITGTNLLKSKKNIDYSMINNDSILTQETYIYNGKYQLVNTIQTNSIGRKLSKEYTYPPMDSELNKRNMLSTIIKTKTTHNEKIVGIIENVYPKNTILPTSIQTSTDDISYRTDISYDIYDKYGNIQQYTTLNGISTTVLWGYGGQYPIAEIKNARYNDIILRVSENNLKTIADKMTFNTQDSILINNLRLDPTLVNSQVSTFTYKPLIGMTSMTDPAGLITRYKYDSFGRLLDITDHQGRVITSYDYHYNKHSAGMIEDLRIQHNSIYSFNYDGKILYRINSDASFELISENKDNQYQYEWTLFSVETNKNIPINLSKEKIITIKLLTNGIMKLTCIATNIKTKEQFESQTIFEVANLPLKIDIPISENYFEGKINEFKSLVMGGSGNYTYEWTLKSSLNETVASGNTSIFAPFLPEKVIGNYTLTLIVKDKITNETKTLTKTVNVIYRLLDFEIDVLDRGLSSYHFRCKLHSGSGNYSYEWILKDNIESILGTSSAENYEMKISECGEKTIICTIRDLTTGETKTVSKDFIVYESIQFRNVETRIIAPGRKMMTFDVYSPQNAGFDVSFNGMAYDHSKRSQVIYSFEESSNYDIMELPGSKTIKKIFGTNITKVTLTLDSENSSRAIITMSFVVESKKANPYLEGGSISLSID